MDTNIFCVQIVGTKAIRISIEVDISVGLFNFKIVGLTDKSIDEAKERIHAALKNNTYTSPKSSNRKTTISLAPAEIRKNGSHFDTAIAIAYLIASKQIKRPKRPTLILGELSFDGSIQSTKGIFSMVIQAQDMGIERIFIPMHTKSNLFSSLTIEIIECSHLQEIIKHLNQEDIAQKEPETIVLPQEKTYLYDEVHGNEQAKRALLIALSGGHNISFCGTPGTGKTLLAKTASELLPSLSLSEEIEVQSLYSLSNSTKENLTAPFRNPHHHSSIRTLFGGGKTFIPGEILLAHRGILFLDEFPEFNRGVTEGLREILQDKQVRISRPDYTIDVPVDIILIISHNPCPCGYYQSTLHSCTCNPYHIQRYKSKLSGPITDRIDMHIYLEQVSYTKFIHKNTNLTSEAEVVREQIQKARDIQYKKRKCLNSNLTNKKIQSLPIDEKALLFLNKKAEDLHLSGRGYYSVLKIAQTIVDIEGYPHINKESILEALYFRSQYKT